MQITLSCAPGRFIYRDNGPGLSQDALHVLLNGIWSEELLSKGGLGLPLIRTYCKAMSWQISQPEGERGLLFTLPPCKAEDARALELSSPDAYSIRRRRALYERELQACFAASCAL